MDAGKVPDDDLVRAELYRRFGCYPTESSEHHAEYNPWFIPKGQVEPFHVPIGEYLSRVAHNLDEYAETKRMLDAGEPFEIERSGEYAAVIINAIATGEPARIVANVMNDGGALIANLAGDACVEVPALVDGLGVHPTPIGALPPQCAAYIRPAVDTQALTVRAALDQDRDLVYHAVLTDPIVQARLTLDRGVAADRRADRRRGGVAPRVARRHRTRLDLVNDRRRPPMLATTQGPRRLGAALLAAVIAVVVAACGGSTATSSAPAAASAAAPSQPAPAGSAATGESPAASAAGYTGPPATIEYSIWGDPQEIASQTRPSWRRSTPPTRTSRSTSTSPTGTAYWDKLQTGLAGGAAPDVFAMDGPLFPDYQSRDVLLDLKPFDRPRRVRPDPARRPGRRRLHDGGRRPVRPAARPQRRSRSTTTRRCSTRPGSRTRTTPGTGPSSSRSPSS